MKDIPSSPGARRVQAWVAEGEHDRQDFKLTVSDPRKIARSISAFANNKGGRLLLGVKDNGVVAGVRNEEDVYVLEQAGQLYCTPPQELDFHAFSIDARTRIIVATVNPAPERPVRVLEASGERKAYFRVADENIVAHPVMVQAWMQKSRSTLRAFNVGEQETQLLQLLARGPERGMDTAEIAVGLHLSQARTNAILVNLAAMELIAFRFDGTRFLITPGE